MSERKINHEGMTSCTNFKQLNITSVDQIRMLMRKFLKAKRITLNSDKGCDFEDVMKELYDHLGYKKRKNRFLLRMDRDIFVRNLRKVFFEEWQKARIERYFTYKTT